MQARFVSLRVTETWQMVDRRNPNAAPSPGASLATREVDPQTAPPQPQELAPAPRREPTDA
jgi:hypothetical protein